MTRRPPRSTLFPSTTLFRSDRQRRPRNRLLGGGGQRRHGQRRRQPHPERHGLRHLRNRSEEHTSELQSQFHLVCRLLLEKKNALDVNRLALTHALLDKLSTS